MRWESHVSWMMSSPSTDVSDGAFKKLGVKAWCEGNRQRRHSDSTESAKCKDSTHVTFVKRHTRAQPIPLSQVGAWSRSLYCDADPSEGVFTLTKLPGCVPGCVLSQAQGNRFVSGESGNWVYPRFQSYVVKRSA